MNTTESLSDLWRFIDEGRGREPVSSLVQSWLQNRILHDEPITRDLLYAMIDKRLSWFDGEHHTPKPLNSFISRLARVHPAQSVLDPTCGIGLLLDEVAASTGANVIHGIDINAWCCSIARAMLGANASIIEGDALESSNGLRACYDLIVANPPFGLRVRGTIANVDRAKLGEMGWALAEWVCQRLSDSGVAMVILTPGFLSSKSALGAREAVAKAGCRIRALISLPGGTFPHTQISTYLAVFERGEQHDVFIGEYADDLEHQRILIANYKSRKSGDQLSRGRMCPLSTFRGFSAFAANERLKRLVKARGWRQHPGNSLIQDSRRLGASEEDVTPTGNSLVLRLFGKPQASLDAVDVAPSRARDYVRLAIDPNIADARYLVHWLTESAVGQATLASVSYEVGLRWIEMNALKSATFYLPTLLEQRSTIEAAGHLNRIRAEAEELENALWSSTEQVSDVAERIRTINQEDRYEDWIDTLPFPLASILWRHRAGGGGPRDQYEVLLHFFEATAAFVATIHLSAFMSDDSMWSETAPGLRDTLAAQKLSLERATFGAWKTVVEYLAGKCKGFLNRDDGVETCKRVYGTTNPRHIAMLCQGDLLSALQRANKIRNDSSGHGGAIGPDEAQLIHDELVQLVYKIRGVFGRSWLDYELIQPSESRYRGGIYHYGAKRLMGTRSAPFMSVQRESTLPLESDRLYLFDAASQKGMLLQPFIQVMPSPEKKANACFIFSRYERGDAHFISYHFEQESSLTRPFPGIDEAFQRIHIFDRGSDG
jgi:hypothetical protein